MVVFAAVVAAVVASVDADDEAAVVAVFLLSEELSELPQAVNEAVTTASPIKSAIVFFIMIFLSEKGLTAKQKKPLHRQKALQTDSSLRICITVRSIPRDLDISVMYQQNGRFPDLCIITPYSLPDRSVTYCTALRNYSDEIVQELHLLPFYPPATAKLSEAPLELLNCCLKTYIL